MLAAAIVDIGMTLLSAVLSAGIEFTLVMVVITGVIPVLAIATVSAIEGGLNRRSVSSSVEFGGELASLAARVPRR